MIFTHEEIDSMVMSIPIGTMLTRRQSWFPNASPLSMITSTRTIVVFGHGQLYGVDSDASTTTRVVLETMTLKHVSTDQCHTWDPEMGEFWLHMFQDELFGDHGFIEDIQWDVVYLLP